MRRSTALAAIALVASGCSYDHDTCAGLEPRLEDVRVAAGSYTATNPYLELAGAAEIAESPHRGGRNFTVQIDRDAGKVRVSFDRDGKRVREIWRTVGAEVGYHRD